MHGDSHHKRAFFDQAADGWETPLRGQDKMDLVDRILDTLAPPRAGRILDLPTGAGAAIPLLARRLSAPGAVVAVDVSMAMLGAIPTALRESGLTWPVQGDAYALPFRDASFDTVFCMAGLAHMADKARAIGEMARLLAPGGRAAIVFLSCRQYLDRLHSQIGGAVAHDRIPPLGEMEALFRDAGLLPEYLINERERLYLAVGRKTNSLALAERVVAVATDQLRRYPRAEPADLYKALHQATMGPGHALADPEAALAHLAEEYARVDPAPHADLIEDISLERHVLRVHLGAYKTCGLPVEDLHDAFVRAASLFAPTLDRMGEVWDCLEEGARSRRIPGMPDGWERFGRSIREAGFPPTHHSQTFREAYAPAYRLVCPATEGLPPFLTRALGARPGSRARPG